MWVIQPWGFTLGVAKNGRGRVYVHLKNLAVTGGQQALNNCEVTSFIAKGLSVFLPEVAQCGSVVAKSLDIPSKIRPPPFTS